MNSTYTPPKVWSEKSVSTANSSSLNKATAGSRFDKELPCGDNPLQLYSLGTPNGVKVTILLEELVELGIQEAEYDAYLINISDGDQFSSGFVSINPNSKIPARGFVRTAYFTRTVLPMIAAMPVRC